MENLTSKTMIPMLEQEFKYYVDHQDELVEKYNGKYLVIKGENVIGVYDSEIAAYLETKERHKEGTFLIQYCAPGKENYIQNFHSWVTFS